MNYKEKTLKKRKKNTNPKNKFLFQTISYILRKNDAFCILILKKTQKTRLVSEKC